MQKSNIVEAATENVADSEDNGIDERYIVPGLSRGLAALQLFTRDRSAQKLTEIAAGLGLSRSAAYRIVYTLESEGFLKRDPNTRQYRLTSRVLSLGFDFLSSQPLTESAQPFLREVSDHAQATAYLVVVEGWEAVYLSRVAPSATVITNLRIGMRIPAHAVSSGRIILAFSPETLVRDVHALSRVHSKTVPVSANFADFQAALKRDRERGYTLNRSIFEPAVTACAAPIRNRLGNAVAAISIVAPHSVFGDSTQSRRIAMSVVSVAAAMSRQLGFAG